MRFVFPVVFSVMIAMLFVSFSVRQGHSGSCARRDTRAQTRCRCRYTGDLRPTCDRSRKLYAAPKAQLAPEVAEGQARGGSGNPTSERDITPDECCADFCPAVCHSRAQRPGCAVDSDEMT